SLSSIPGAAAVALCIYSPLGDNNYSAGVWAEGKSAPGPNDDNLASWDRVTAGYFGAIGNPIVEGRGITEHDTAASRRVVVINQAFGRKLFKNQNQLVTHIAHQGAGSEREYEIIGIAEDASYMDYDIDKHLGPFYFLLLA